MFVSDKPPIFNGLAVLEGSFTFLQHAGLEPKIVVRAAYMNDSARTTHGYVDFTSPSKKTIEAFREFIKSIEEDVGNLVYEGGNITEFGIEAPTARAESNEGLPKGLGG
jgi:hypothetical protein